MIRKKDLLERIEKLEEQIFKALDCFGVLICFQKERIEEQIIENTKDIFNLKNSKSYDYGKDIKELSNRVDNIEEIVATLIAEKVSNMLGDLATKLEKCVNEQKPKTTKSKKPTTKKNLAVQNKNKKVGK
jgi:hypothetical protein